MSSSAPGFEPSLVILADDGELPACERVWGTGGWLDPGRRAALDWLTLAHLSGWRTRVMPIAASSLPPQPGSSPRRIVLASEAHAHDRPMVDAMARVLGRDAVLAIVPAAPAGSPLAILAAAERGCVGMTGQDLVWVGPGPSRRWVCRRSIAAWGLEVGPGAEVWATLDGTPVVAARRVGGGRIASLGFDASAARDAAGAATSLLLHLLVRGSSRPIAWLDLDGAFVLRMDDPGGAQNVHHRRWCYDKLTAAAWGEIGAELARRRARLSIGYVSAWVDDGDARRGELTVDGSPAEARRPGAVHPSPRVRYRDLAANSPGAVSDYSSEYRGILDLVRRGLAAVELHGYTHMHPDLASWAKAPDRHDAVHWYRELGPAASTVLAALPAAAHPIALGRAAIRRWFGESPTTLICPGDEWTTAALEAALAQDLELVSSYYLALRIAGRFCWSTHVCAPYLDAPTAAHFDAPLPVVGYFHDREPALSGVAWLSRWLDAWTEAGATRFLSFRELAGALAAPIHLERDPWRLQLGGDPLRRMSSAPVGIWTGAEDLPSQLALVHEEGETLLAVEGCDDGSGRVRIPGSGHPSA